MKRPFSFRLTRKPKAAWGWAFAALAALWLVSADPLRAAEGDARQRLNLILVSATNTRADHLGLYGYHRATSPNLDALGRRAVVMKNAFTHASWTLPVAVSLFTSQYPFTHGLMNRDESPVLAAETPTFIDVLRGAGYQTAAFVGDRDYSPRHGHTSRFEWVFDSVKKADNQRWSSYGVFDQTLPPARKWLEEHHQKPFCLLIQGYDTHCPFARPTENSQFDPNYKGGIDFTKCYWTFEPTRPIRKRAESGLYQDVYLLKTRPETGEDSEVMFYPEDVDHMVALYDGEIHNVDEMLGGLFRDIDRLGLRENTIVVFYSDHGDMFGKHGRFMRGGPLRGTFYDDVLRIPLIIQIPRLPAKSIDDLVEVVDMAPTFLDLLGLPIPPSFKGRSFRASLEGKEASKNSATPYVFAGSTFNPGMKNDFFKYPSVILSARSREWKMIVERVDYPQGPRETTELYELTNDPQELRDLSGRRADKVSEMREAMCQWLQRIQATNVLSAF
ncbi:MAG: sulfatase [Verrucomicrobia bacterium]|nr:sulfatase [Verrucomicrobiota bacterium]MBI3870237.1 sulfatase [Verrucomicrobiota bacterium]